MVANVKITHGHKEYINQASHVMGEAMKDDPLFRFFLSTMTEQERHAYLSTFIKSLLTASVLNGGVIHEAEDWASCAAWMPPGKRADNPLTMVQSGLLAFLWKNGFGGFRRLFVDYMGKLDTCKAQGVRDAGGKPLENYHGLFLIVTDHRHRGRGLASAIINAYKSRAIEDGLPIWLDATTEKSRKIYRGLGFEDVGEFRVGDGTHSENGAEAAGGPGVPIYGMVWDPRKKSNNT